MGYAGEITTLSFDYDIACSTASFLSGLLLASLCLRALRLERRRGALGSPVDSQSHQPALLQILLFVGLTDAYYAAGWMLLVVAQGYPHLAGLPPTPPAVWPLTNFSYDPPPMWNIVSNLPLMWNIVSNLPPMWNIFSNLPHDEFGAQSGLPPMWNKICVLPPMWNIDMQPTPDVE